MCIQWWYVCACVYVEMEGQEDLKMGWGGGECDWQEQKGDARTLHTLYELS